MPSITHRQTDRDREYIIICKSVTIICPLLSESHHHLTSSNVTSKLNTLPRHNSHHLATTPHLLFNSFNFGVLPNFYITLHMMLIANHTVCSTISYKWADETKLSTQRSSV